MLIGPPPRDYRVTPPVNSPDGVRNSSGLMPWANTTPILAECPPGSLDDGIGGGPATGRRAGLGGTADRLGGGGRRGPRPRRGRRVPRPRRAVPGGPARMAGGALRRPRRGGPAAGAGPAGRPGGRHREASRAPAPRPAP